MCVRVWNVHTRIRRVPREYFLKPVTIRRFQELIRGTNMYCQAIVFSFFSFFLFFLSKHHDRKVWIHIRVWSTDIRITHVPDESIFPRTRWDKALIRTDHEKKKKLNAVSVIVFLLSAAFCFIQDITLYQFSVAWHMDIGMCWTRWTILGICSFIKMKCCRVSNCFYYPTSALAKPDLSVTRFACCCGSVFLPLSLSVYFHLLTRPCQWFSFCFPFSSQ